MPLIELDSLAPEEIEAAAEDMGLEAGQYVELFKLFAANWQADLDALEQALDAGDTGEALSKIHSFRGTAENMRLKRLRSPAKKLELALRSGQADQLALHMTSLRFAASELQEEARARGLLHSPQ